MAEPDGSAKAANRGMGENSTAIKLAKGVELTSTGAEGGLSPGAQPVQQLAAGQDDFWQGS